MKRRFARKQKEDPYPPSSRDCRHVCPGCGQDMTLHDLRDGDQAYWCHACDRGHRAGDPPLAALQPADVA